MNLNKSTPRNIKNEVSNYYAHILKSSADLKTSACCSPNNYSVKTKSLLELIHPEVKKHYYGCGLISPDLLEGQKVLDLGCGAGQDAYLLSQLVGPKGLVVGVDMTLEQLKIAKQFHRYQMDQFKYKKSNVQFLQGDLENLELLPLDVQYFDVITSNCVLNLVQNKMKVLTHVWHLLKEGGEFYFSDIYSSARIPRSLKADPVIYGECLAGALYWKDFLQLARKVGFKNPRVVEGRPISIKDEKIKAKIGDLKFYSITYRLFKVPELEDHGEDYNLKIEYKGDIKDQPDKFQFDSQFTFPAHKSIKVCSNTFITIKKSRYASHCNFHGNFVNHRGPFMIRKSPYSFLTKSPKSKDSCCN